MEIIIVIKMYVFDIPRCPMHCDRLIQGLVASSSSVKARSQQAIANTTLTSLKIGLIDVVWKRYITRKRKTI